MKYVIELKSRLGTRDLYYNRQYPGPVKKMIDKATYRKRLYSAADTLELQREVAEHTKAFDAYVRFLRKSDAPPDEVALNKEATLLLQSVELKAGMGHEGAARNIMDEHPEVFSELLDFYDTAPLEVTALPDHLKVVHAAHSLLASSPAQVDRLMYLSDVWPIYEAHRSPHASAKGVYHRFLSFAGDSPLLDEDAVNQKLRKWAQHRLTEVSPSTVSRQLQIVMPALNVAARSQAKPLNLVPPLLPRYKKAKRHTLTVDETKLLIERLLDTEWMERNCKLRGSALAEVRLALMTMTLTSCISSELTRCKRDNYKLDHTVPHIDIREEQGVKAQARARPVVITHYLKELRGLLREIDEGEVLLPHLSSSTPANANMILNRIVKKAVGDHASNYSLRHAVKNRANIIGGSLAPWNEVEDIMGHVHAQIAQGYSESGKGQMERLERQREVLLAVNNILVPPQNTTEDNVVPISASEGA